MKEFLKPTKNKIITSIGLILVDYCIGFLWPFLSFYNYFCTPEISMNARMICTRSDFNVVKFFVVILFVYILASFIDLMPRNISKLIIWTLLTILFIGLIVLFVGF